MIDMMENEPGYKAGMNAVLRHKVTMRRSGAGVEVVLRLKNKEEVATWPEKFRLQVKGLLEEQTNDAA
jgi:hypothetical protein